MPMLLGRREFGQAQPSPRPQRENATSPQLGASASAGGCYGSSCVDPESNREMAHFAALID